MSVFGKEYMKASFIYCQSYDLSNFYYCDHTLKAFINKTPEFNIDSVQH